jgi:hypothetical protein
MFVQADRVRKPLEFRDARRLRAIEGMPYKKIASVLEISPATAFAWTRDIELSPEQNRRNLVGPGGPCAAEAVARRAVAWREKNRARRRTFQEAGRESARLGEPLHMALCMLYWAEGSKARNTVQLVNSDPHMVRFFRDAITQCFGAGAERFALRLNVYLGNCLALREIEDHWLQVLDLPRSCLRGHQLNHFPTSSSGQKRNRLPYGVASLRVSRSTEIVQHIYGAIQEYGDFDEPRWLDGPPRRQAAAAASRSPS